MDDEAPNREEAKPVGTATVLAIIAVGVLDAEMPQLPEIGDDGTDGKGIPNIDPDGITAGDANASNDGQEGPDHAGTAPETDPL